MIEIKVCEEYNTMPNMTQVVGKMSDDLVEAQKVPGAPSRFMSGLQLRHLSRVITFTSAPGFSIDLLSYKNN